MIMIFGWLIVMLALPTVLFKLWGRKAHAFFTGGTPIVLEDYNGKTHKTIAYKNAFGTHYAHVYWCSKVGWARLLEKGEVEQPNYIKRWVQG